MDLPINLNRDRFRFELPLIQQKGWDSKIDNLDGMSVNPPVDYYGAETPPTFGKSQSRYADYEGNDPNYLITNAARDVDGLDQNSALNRTLVATVIHADEGHLGGEDGVGTAGLVEHVDGIGHTGGAEFVPGADDAQDAASLSLCFTRWFA